MSVVLTAREYGPVVDRRTLRRMFLSAFESEGLHYAGEGCEVVHAELTWTMSLVVDGTGTRAPYRLVLGASLPQLEDPAPRNAEACHLHWPLAYEDNDGASRGAPRLPDAVFPEWAGTDDDRITAIAQCVGSVVRYARQVDSLEELRVRYSMDDYESAFIAAPLRLLLEEAS